MKTTLAVALAAAFAAGNASALGLEGLKTALGAGGAVFDGRTTADAGAAAKPPISDEAKKAREDSCLRERRRAGRHWGGWSGRRPGRAGRVERAKRASAAKKTNKDCNPSEG